MHGAQEAGEFHAYYDSRCYLPLYVFCGQGLLACYLRRSRIDGAKNATALIKALVSRLRQAWPRCRFIIRGDSGFCRQRLLRWCERNDVGYVIGLARNARLHDRVALTEQAMADEFMCSRQRHRKAWVTRSTVRLVPAHSSRLPLTWSGPLGKGLILIGPSRCASGCNSLTNATRGQRAAVKKMTRDRRVDRAECADSVPRAGPYR